MKDLYESMAKHPHIAPVFDLLKLVDPCDEFSRALCLVRDCFSPNTTLRALSRDQLAGVLAERTNLLLAYETAVYEAARAIGAKPKTFLDAVDALPDSIACMLREAFEQQVAKLMGRPLA